ncbi:MAG: acyltransferase family protein [Chthoniobacterales bacterium]
MRNHSGRIPELEGLRGVLAWTVVAFHIVICSGWFGPTLGGSNLFSDVAEGAVDAFILLSGFAITRLVLVERETYRRYIWRRVCRIYPAYWVALAIAISLNGLLAENLRHFLPAPAAQAYVQICEIGALRAQIDVPLHVFLLHGLAPFSWLPAAPYTFLGVAWSLSLEEQFYFLAPAVISFATRARVTAIALGVICLTTALCARPIITTFSNAFLPAKAIFFFVGGLSFVVLRNEQPRNRATLGIAALCLILFCFWFAGTRRLVEAVLPAAIWALVMTSIASARFGVVSRSLRSLPLQYLGRSSYSTYLFHAPVITAIQAVIWRVANPATHLTLFVLTAPLSIVMTLLVSYLSWRFIERPFQRLGYARFGMLKRLPS